MFRNEVKKLEFLHKEVEVRKKSWGKLDIEHSL